MLNQLILYLVVIGAFLLVALATYLFFRDAIRASRAEKKRVADLPTLRGFEKIEADKVILESALSVLDDFSTSARMASSFSSWPRGMGTIDHVQYRRTKSQEAWIFEYQGKDDGDRPQTVAYFRFNDRNLSPILISPIPRTFPDSRMWPTRPSFPSLKKVCRVFGPEEEVEFLSDDLLAYLESLVPTEAKSWFRRSTIGIEVAASCDRLLFTRPATLVSADELDEFFQQSEHVSELMFAESHASMAFGKDEIKPLQKK